MLNNTIQDILVRRARMTGKNALWVPGTDHASIATEAKVVAKLAEKGIQKSDLTREEFLKHAWDWTHQYGGIILQQLRKLGASCDWSRTALHHGRSAVEKCHKGICRSLPPRAYLPRQADGQLGSQGQDRSERH